MQRRKGATGERELVQQLNARGLMCRRTVQYAGKPGTAADVVCEALPLHIECKRTERLAWAKTLRQVQHDSRGKPWVIAYRYNGGPWLIIQTLDHWTSDSKAAALAIEHRRAIIDRESERLKAEGNDPL